MKTIFLTLIATTLLVSNAAFADTCGIGYVDRIVTGYDDDFNKFAVSLVDSSGDRIYNPHDNSAYFVADHGTDLDEDTGFAPFGLLQTALIYGYKVRIKDHSGTRCDDFGEVRITR